MRLTMTIAALAVALLSAPANADPLATIQAFTITDVKTAEAIYAANPSVPTYAAATQCLGYMDATLSAQGGQATIGSLTAPKGVASAIADLDVALNSANTGLSPVVLSFNQNCGGYIEDLKAEVAKVSVQGGISIFGLHL